MPKVLVTGGLGFIGSHVVDFLIKKDYEVAVIDKKLWTTKEYANPKAVYFHTDISNAKRVRGCFGKFRPNYVIHCAAEARIQPSFENPQLYYQANVVGTLNILVSSKEFGVKRVIYSASSSAYGGQSRMPLQEDMLLSSQALHPYGSTKRQGEMLMKDMGKITGGPETVCLRYFNVYGPRQTELADGPYATVVGIFLNQYREGLPLTIVPSGQQRRDFTWVGDVVNANFLAMYAPLVGDAEIINIGFGKSYSIFEVAKMILGSDFDKEGSIEMIAPRKGEVLETLADITRAKYLLDWVPKVSMKEGIERIWKNKI